MKKVFIDGQAGTTGLKIFDRLKSRDDLDILLIEEDKRKDIDTKISLLNEADIVILCLPDQASIESVKLIKNPETKVIDTSTAHRTDDNWVYGLPELNKNQRNLIKSNRLISNPGCYPTGVILLLNPLTFSGIMSPDYSVSVNAVSGYSGGGKKLIETYENDNNTNQELLSYRPYALGVRHKHVSEMQKYSGLNNPPIFVPSVGNFYNGMLISIPIFPEHLNKNVKAKDIIEIYRNYYKNEQFIDLIQCESKDFLSDGFLSPLECNETNKVELFVFDHDNRILLMSRLDNLGKGASGAAVQNLNIMLGFDESISLL